MAATTTPMFSVIMPVYDHAAYVAAAVRSVIDQTVADWELILVDDGSSDGSGRIVDDLAAGDERITVIHQANAGQAAARNAALAVAKGGWLAYIDSDDLYLPDALATYADYIAAHPDVQFMYGYRHRLNEDESLTHLAGEFQDRPTGPAELFGRMHLSHLCVCYRRELIDRAGGYDEALRTCEDYELYLRLSLLCRFEPLGKATGLRRRHGGNVSRQTGVTRFREAQVLQRFVETLGGRDVLDDDLIRRRLGRLYYASARQYFKSGYFGCALHAVRRAHEYRRTFKSTAIRVLAGALKPLDRTHPDPLPLLM